MQNLVIQDLDSWRFTYSGLSASQLHIHNMLRLTIAMGAEFILLENNYRVFTFKYPKTYLLIPWSRVLLEKLTGYQLVKNFPTFYGTQMFITAFKSARHLALS